MSRAVKRQEKRLNLGELVTKSEKLLQKYSDYAVEYRLLSVKDLKNYCVRKNRVNI